jgi:hypothetical protein
VIEHFRQQRRDTLPLLIGQFLKSRPMNRWIRRDCIHEVNARRQHTCRHRRENGGY